jgi:hypothetical protein
VIAFVCAGTLCLSLLTIIATVVYNDVTDKQRVVAEGMIWVAGLLVIAIAIPLVKIAWNSEVSFIPSA